MKVKQIQIKHPYLGEIIVSGNIDKKILKLVGETCELFREGPVYYYANISETENGMYHLKNIKVIKPEKIVVGGSCRFGDREKYINVFTDRVAGDDIVVNLPSLLSVIYEPQRRPNTDKRR